MKRQAWSMILCVVLLLHLVMPAPIYAETLSDDDPWYLSYEIEGGTATVTDCDGSMTGEVVVPDTLGGYPVYRIGYRAFAACYKITSVYIPDSVRYIDDFAFSYSFRITSVSLPVNLLLLGDRAFEGSDGLTDVYIRGTEAQWYATIYGGNKAYWSAKIHFLGCNHSWTDATCSSPKTCTTCGAVEGTALSHEYDEYIRCIYCGKPPLSYGKPTTFAHSDAVYLLYHTVLPNAYPLSYDGDINDDGSVDSKDAVYLLYHILLPDQYPI